MRKFLLLLPSMNLFNSPLSEHKKYNLSLHQRTIFPFVNPQSRGSLSHVVLSFRFRSIEFNKKRALPFFLARELLTHRKCVASLSGRNVQAWKVRKGRLVGCKVTLRRDGQDDFRDLLFLTFSRREKFQAPRGILDKFFKQNSIKKGAFARQMKASQEFKSRPAFSLSLGELVLFYPIELGLGLHADVQRVGVTFIFAASSIEERFFLRRFNKVPVIS